MNLTRYLDLLKKESKELSALDEIERTEKYLQRKSRSLFFNLCERHGLSFINNLKQKLQKNENIQYFKQFEVNLLEATLGEISACYPTINGTKSIDAFLKNIKPKIPDNEVAGVLSMHQDIESIEYLLSKIEGEINFEDFSSCLLSEVILRKDIRQSHILITYFNTTLKETWLNKLPSYMLNVEKEFPVIHFSPGNDGGWGCSSYYLGDIEVTEIGQENSTVVIKEKPCNPCFDMAVKDWVETSNGAVIQKCFQVKSQIVDDKNILLAVLKRMDISFEAVSASYKVKKIKPVNLLAILGNATTTGGAYSSLKCFKNARLDTWMSYSGITNREIDELVENNDKELKGIVMFSVIPDNDWFYQVAWDLYLVVIDKENSSVCVLAATDSD